MSEVHSKGEDWRLMSEVPRRLAGWESGLLAWILRSARDRWRKSTFELWPRGGAAGQLLGAAPAWACTLGPRGFFPAS